MDVRTEQYGRYEIKSAPLKGEWAANAFRNKKKVAEARAVSFDEVLIRVKARLDQLDATELSSRDKEGAPSASAYLDAFIALGKIPEGYEAMLRAHLQAPDHLISATQLAEAAGYENYNAANLHYGLLGKRIGDEIGFIPPRRVDGSEIWTCVLARAPDVGTDFPETSLAEALDRAVDAGHFEWQLRPQVAEALRALGY
jgi:hypothetical protein